MAKTRQRPAPPLSSDIAYRTILQVDDEYVRALVVEIRPEGVLIIGAGKERRIDIGQPLQASTLAPVCEDALRQAEDMTERVIGHLIVPDIAIVGVPSTHIVGVTSMACVLRPQPEREIGKRELSHLLSRLYHVAEQRAALATASSDSAPSLEVVESRIIEVQVDGHAVTNPIRFRGNKVEATAMVLFAEVALIAEWQRLLDLLKLEPRLVSGSWAMASAMREQDAIGLVLHAGHSTLLWLEKGVVRSVENCAYGGNELASDLALALDIPRLRADALRAAYLRKELDEELGERLKQSMKRSARRWLEALNATLSKMAEQRDLPPRLCYAEATLGFPALEEILLAWMGTWPLDRFPSVRRLDPAYIPGISERTGKIGDDPADIQTLALAHYAGRLQSETDPMDQMLRDIAHHARRRL